MIGVLDEAPLAAPAAMSDREATALARRIFGATGAILRSGSACVVGERNGPRGVLQRGHGPTWEAAFDAALTAAGR